MTFLRKFVIKRLREYFKHCLQLYLFYLISWFTELYYKLLNQDHVYTFMCKPHPYLQTFTYCKIFFNLYVGIKMLA